MTVSPFCACVVVRLNLAVWFVTTINLYNAPCGNLSILIVPLVILAALRFGTSSAANEDFLAQEYTSLACLESVNLESLSNITKSSLTFIFLLVTMFVPSNLIYAVDWDVSSAYCNNNFGID